MTSASCESASTRRVEGGGDVFGGPMDALDVLEEADGLGHGLRERVVQLLRIAAILAAHLAGDVALDEIVDLVEAGERAEGLVREVHGRVDEELLSELDDGAVGAADVLASAALRAQARDDLDDEVNLVGQQRIEVDEAVARQFGQLDVGGEPGVLGEAAAVLFEQLAERVCAAAFFESTRRLVTSEMSDGSRWTCSGKRSISRASSTFCRRGR